MIAKKVCQKMGQLAHCARVVQVVLQKKAWMASAIKQKALDETTLEPIRWRCNKI